MKYKIINYLLVGIAFSAALTSCKKQLDLRPTDTIDDTKAFQTVGDLRKGANGVYSQVGTGLGNSIYIAATLSDEVKLSTENLGQGQFFFKWQISSSAVTNDASGSYLTFYRAIDRGHRVLAAMDRVPAANAQEEMEKKSIRAELLALRAIAHFELLRRYMPSGYDPNALGVPVVLESSLLQKPARNTVGEVVDQILSDLAAARSISELPDIVADGLKISKSAVAAYQAKVSLLKRDWTAALNFANDAITLSGKTLATRTQYPNIWTDASNAEVILRFRNNYTIPLLWRGTNGGVDFEPSDKLKNQYNRTTDVRFTTFFGSASGDTSIITKYPGTASIGPTVNDVKATRIAEMYLIRAEAYAELNQLDMAAAQINAIRANRISGYVDISFSSKDEAITAILNERYKELAFEGYRFFDLKRRGLAIVRNASDALPTWRTLDANDYRFALPIPAEEVFANPNTVQNPGY